MLTRGPVTHAYAPMPVGRETSPGIVKVSVVQGIAQSWAIARPGSSPTMSGAPWYMAPHPRNVLYQAGAFPLTPPRYRREMDPSDKSTWQRSYQF
jgi:hypothetical protein